MDDLRFEPHRAMDLPVDSPAFRGAVLQAVGVGSALRIHGGAKCRVANLSCMSIFVLREGYC